MTWNTTKGTLLVLFIFCALASSTVQTAQSVKDTYDKRGFSWGDIKDGAENAANSAQSAAQSAASAAQSAAQSAGETIANGAQTVANGAQSAAETVANGAQTAAQTVANGAQDDFKNSLQQLKAYKIAKCVYDNQFGMVTVVQLVDTGLDRSSAELSQLLGIDEATARSIIKITVISAAGAVVVYYLVPVALPLIGFTEEGIASGSLAALIQSVVYKGETAGLFSLLQSAGALGLSSTAQVIMAILGGGVSGAGAAAAGGVGESPDATPAPYATCTL